MSNLKQQLGKYPRKSLIQKFLLQKLVTNILMDVGFRASRKPASVLEANLVGHAAVERNVGFLEPKIVQIRAEVFRNAVQASSGTIAAEGGGGMRAQTGRHPLAHRHLLRAPKTSKSMALN
jgi:hypothetical protein